ncbi:Uncharacterized protein PBTT_06080 [Plasmodiophora brassicae]
MFSGDDGASAPDLRLSLSVTAPGTIRVRMRHLPDGLRFRVEMRSAPGVRRRRSAPYSKWATIVDDGLAADDCVVAMLSALLPEHSYQVGVRVRVPTHVAWGARTLFRFQSPPTWTIQAPVRVFLCRDADPVCPSAATSLEVHAFHTRTVTFLLDKANADLPGSTRIGRAYEARDDRLAVMKWMIAIMERVVASDQLLGAKRHVVRAVVDAAERILNDPDPIPRPVDFAGGEVSDLDRLRLVLYNCKRVHNRKSGKASQLLRSLKNIVRSMETGDDALSISSGDEANASVDPWDTLSVTQTTGTGSCINVGTGGPDGETVDGDIREVYTEDVVLPEIARNVNDGDGHVVFAAAVVVWLAMSMAYKLAAFFAL